MRGWFWYQLCRNGACVLPETAEGVDVIFVRLRVVLVLLVLSVFILVAGHMIIGGMQYLCSPVAFLCLWERKTGGELGLMYFQLFFIEIIFDLVCALYYELTVFVWIINGFIFWNSSEFFFFACLVWAHSWSTTAFKWSLAVELAV